MILCIIIFIMYYIIIIIIISSIIRPTSFHRRSAEPLPKTFASKLELHLNGIPFYYYQESMIFIFTYVDRPNQRNERYIKNCEANYNS